ncbi:MAG TPA: winged helix-turn-helix transcriptional regulator [Solirubrobacterales bacterium]
MASISNVIDEARNLLEKRLAELDDERKRVERALANLIEGKGGRRRGRPKGSTSKSKKSAPRRRRGRRGGTRADQAVKLIEANPGITASEIAKTMKIKPNYLYRVLGELEKEGRVKKKGRQYNAA